MILEDLFVLKFLIAIAITYLIIYSESLKGILLDNKSDNNSYISASGLIFLFLILSLLLQDYFTVLYLLGIIVVGRVFKAPWGFIAGLFSAVYSFWLGINIYPFGLGCIILGVIAERYYIIEEKSNFKYKDLILTLLLTIVFAYQFNLTRIFTLFTTILATQTIITIRKKELENQIKQKENLKDYKLSKIKLDGIEKVIELMSSNFEVEETYQELLDLSCNLIGVGAGGFLINSEEDDLLELRVMRGLDHKHFVKLNFSKNKGCLGDLYNSDKKIILLELEENLDQFDAQIFSDDGFQSMLAIKVFINDNKSGILFFLHYDKGYFSYSNILGLNSIIEYAPSMINKAKVFEKMERNVAGLSTLQRTSSTINSTLDLDEVFELTVDVIMGTMGVSMAGLLIIDKETNELKLVSSAGIPADKSEHIISVAKRLSRDTIKNNQKIIKDKLKQEEIDKFELDNIKSVVCIPLKVRGMEIGTINAAQTEFARNFRESDKRFLTTLANQIAIAIENARMYNQMEELATKDGLTKLYNHSHFQEVLDREIENVERHDDQLSLLMMDIDNFKGFNDTYGHQAGDEVLRRLAALLKEEVRTPDTVARYGGEEFSIILPRTGEVEAYEVAERINEEVREMTVEFDDLKLKVTISIGIATYRSGYSKKQLINQADQALYEAKHRGKDQACQAKEL